MNVAVGSDRDDLAYITQLEDALSASEDRYRQLFEEDTAGRFVLAPPGRVLDCNQALAKLLGMEAAGQIVGRNLGDFFQDRARFEALLATVRDAGSVEAAELALTRLDGDPINAVAWFTGAVDSEGQVVALLGRLFDVTEFERLKVRLLGARRMEAIGRLAGGIAHEFNNLLSIIDGHAERLVETLAPGHPLMSSATAIQKATSRATALTQQVLAFGRRQTFQWRVVAVHRLIAQVRTVLESVLGEAIEVRCDLPAELPDVKTDPAQLEQAVMNLVLNAREAMPTGGRVTIRVDTMATGDHPPEERPWIRAGTYVRLIVADTGMGMDAATKAHLFEPFFTTKQVGDGTGLGLATVYGIVKQSGGYIWVESEVGRGTSFTLLFPALT